jgi:hypothetical protein
MSRNNICTKLPISQTFRSYQEIKLKKKKLNCVALSASELYRPSDRHLSAKLMPTLADRRSAKRIPTAVNLGFLDTEPLLFHWISYSLYSRGWVDPVPDPVLLRKSFNAGNRIWICSQELWPLDHRCEIGSSESHPLPVTTRKQEIERMLRPLVSSLWLGSTSLKYDGTSTSDLHSVEGGGATYDIYVNGAITVKRTFRSLGYSI